MSFELRMAQGYEVVNGIGVSSAADGLTPSNGATELSPGSHAEQRWAGAGDHAHTAAHFEPGGPFAGELEARQPAPLQVSVPLGSVLVRDLRLLHPVRVRQVPLRPQLHPILVKVIFIRGDNKLRQSEALSPRPLACFCSLHI